MNQRLSPAYYLDVEAVCGTERAPRLQSARASVGALEFAVKMRRFGAGAEFDRRLREGTLTRSHIERLADRIAALHAEAAIAPRHGSTELIVRHAMDNFDPLAKFLGRDLPLQTALAELRDWTAAQSTALRELGATRVANQRIRECHGDLHLGNIALDGEEIVLFDCIEFSEDLRCIDVISDIAFVIVDLAVHGRGDFANLFLNRYLERSGDYAGVAVLRFYLVFRALVRAKVMALRAQQSSQSAVGSAVARQQCRGFLELARSYLCECPQLVITHGFAGSGKTSVSGELAERLGGIRVRSDVERKRFFGLDGDARTASGVGAGIYAAQASEKTYEHLADLARTVLLAGYPVVVDAAFLRRKQRARFADLAAELGVPFRIVALVVPAADLHQRVTNRAEHQADADASEADAKVLRHQLESYEPLQDAELGNAQVADGSHAPPQAIADRLFSAWCAERPSEAGSSS